MTADFCYKIMLYAAAKNLQNGYVSPDDFNEVIMPTAQRSYLDYLRGSYQQYQAKRPIAVVAFSENQMIRQSLAPLVYGAVLSPNNVTGIASFPSDFEFVDAMWSLYGIYNIRFAQQDRLSSYYRSEIDPVQQNPIYIIQHEGFHFFPENIGDVRLSYIRTPPPIIWGYDIDGNGLPIYNPAKSQDPVWGETDILNILVRGMALIGVNLQVNTLMGYANEIKQRGQ